MTSILYFATRHRSQHCASPPPVANQLLGLFTADLFLGACRVVLGARRDVDADLAQASPHGRWDLGMVRRA